MSGIVSKRRGKPGNRRLEGEKLEKAMEFIRDPKTRGFGPSFMAEKLREICGVVLSKETIRHLMMEAGLWKAKARKIYSHHYSRERREHVGELVQIDGSYHAWLEERGPKACLLVFADDATSAILAAEFVPTESYFAYGDLCKRYFREHGKPKAFYSDRFSVFRDNHKENLSSEPVTQFQRALTTLDIQLICAHSPQAKGRVERANQTLQDRLIKEMRLQGISSYEETNKYLPDFIQDYNRRFAVQPLSSINFHTKLEPSLDLDFIFSIHVQRLISRTLSFQFDGQTYQIVSKHPPYYFARQEVLLVRDRAGLLSAWLGLDGNILELQLLAKQPKQGAILSSKSAKLEPVPPNYNHPWRTYGKKLNGKPYPIISNTK